MVPAPCGRAAKSVQNAETGNSPTALISSDVIGILSGLKSIRDTRKCTLASGGKDAEWVASELIKNQIRENYFCDMLTR